MSVRGAAGAEGDLGEPGIDAPRRRPTKRVAAGVLFRDPNGAVLLVRPTYTAGWLLPGGHLEPGESPQAGAVREIAEELGLTLRPGRVLGLDWIPARDSEGDAIIIVLDGGTLDPVAVSSVRIQQGELDAWRFVLPRDLPDFLPPGRRRQVEACLRARDDGTVATLADGTPVL